MIFGNIFFVFLQSETERLLTMLHKNLLSLSILLLMSVSLLAQPYCTHRSFSIRDGLSSGAVSSMTQSPDGMMWFATVNGLCCYDGYRFTTFRDNKEADETLTTNRLSKVKANANGDIWCITRDNCLYSFDTHTCRFTDVGEKLSKKYGRQFSFRGVFSLPNGISWVTCDDPSHSMFRIVDADITNNESYVKVDMKALGLEGAVIHSVFLDDNNSEWILSDKATMLYGRTFNNKTPYSMVQPMDKQLYFATEQGQLACYQNGASALTPISIPGISSINCMNRTDSVTLVFGTDKGLISYNTQSGIPTSFGSAKDNIRKVFVDSKRRIWAVNTQNDILMYDTGTILEQRMLLPAPLPVSAHNDNFFLTESNGCIWFIFSNRLLCHYDEQMKKLCVSTASLSNSRSLELPNIRRVFFDNQQNLWYITDYNKLSKISFSYHDIHYHNILAGHNTRAIYYDDNNQLWVGDDDGIVSLFDRHLNLLGYLSPSGKVQTASTTFSSRIFAFFKDSKGRFWIGTKGEGLYMLDESGVHHYTSNPAVANSISSDNIYSIDEDELHNIWIGTYGGGLNLLSTSPSGGVAFINPNNGLSQYPKDTSSNIRRITHDGKGTVLLSTTNGLVTFSNHFAHSTDIKFYISRHVKGQSSSLLSNDVTQTLVDKRGSIYVVSMGGGIQKIISKNLLQEQLLFQTQKKMSSHKGIVLSLIEDADGKIWQAREESLNSYDPDTETLTHYGQGIMDDNIEISEALPAISSDKRNIAIGVMNGFVSFDPHQLKTKTSIPNIIFTDVQFQGETDSHPILHSEELNVPYNKRNLTISFAAIDYSSIDDIRYAYRIEGVDKDWNYLMNGHSASFNNLPAGHLKLQVKSTNRNGAWVDNVQTLSINSHPIFWETPWAWILYLIILVSLIVLGIYIYRIRTLASMEHRLNTMKTRFFTEIGHKLRTPLTLIGGPVTEVLESGNLTSSERDHLEKVQRNSRNMLELVNKMLDHSNTDNYFSEDYDTPLFAGHTSFINANADTQEHKDLKLLVVEDNNDLRSFLINILRDNFTIIEAENGRLGLEKTKTELPDFIITDVMMPEMDGLTMVQHIKENPNICHIPIIVLSAKASLKDRLEGLKVGIDDYITKPFSATYLKQRIENIISQRHMLQQTLLTQLGESIGADRTRNVERFRLDNPQIVDADEEMMENLMKYIDSRIDDQDLKIEELADAVNLGRTVFYGKIRSIVGMSPSDFLRHVRMQRAEDLISKSQMTFSQIAYAVGFSDPKYFTKCFKKETGMTPSEYRQNAKQEKE